MQSDAISTGRISIPKHIAMLIGAGRNRSRGKVGHETELGQKQQQMPTEWLFTKRVKV
jgi:hypothetical protein